MKAQRTGHAGFPLSKSVSLPKIKQETTQLAVNNNSRKPRLTKHETQEKVNSMNSSDVIKDSVSAAPESSKHVHFALNTFNDDQRPRLLTINRMNSLPCASQQAFDQSNLATSHSRTSENDRDASRYKDVVHVPSTLQPKLYRSLSTKTYSISSLSSSPTIVTQTDRRTSMVENFMEITDSDAIQSNRTNFSSLEFSPLLSEQDKKKLNTIRQQTSDEFQMLLPTLFKLGVVLWPKQLFDKVEQLTLDELKQRETLRIIVESDQKASEKQRHLHSAFGAIVPSDDVLHKYSLLRENLSIQGQLCVLEAYRDEIENELTKKFPDWSSVPMKPTRINRNAPESSLSRSSIGATKSRAPNNIVQSISLSKLTSVSNPSSKSINQSFISALPEQLDTQWSKKLLAKIIEQGMNILDDIRKLSEPSASKHDGDTELKAHDIVRQFRRWFDLWSTLYIAV